MKIVEIGLEELVSGVRRVGEAIDMANGTVDGWCEKLDGQEVREVAATLMTCAMVVLGEVADRVEEIAGQVGNNKLTARSAIKQIAAHALARLPEEEPPAPNVEDMPSRPVKAGPSPWGEVR